MQCAVIGCQQQVDRLVVVELILLETVGLAQRLPSHPFDEDAVAHVEHLVERALVLVRVAAGDHLKHGVLLLLE